MKRNIRSGRKFLGGLLVCGVVSTGGVVAQPGVAHASGSGGATSAMGAFFTAMFIVPPVAANEILLLTSSIGNGVAASRGKRPSNGWLGLGYTTSIINIIGGTALVVAGLVAKSYQQTGTSSNGYPTYENVSKVDGAMVGWGTAILALGGAGLGLTIWGHTKPKNPSPSLKLRPIVGADARGGIFAGAALELAGF